MRFRLLALILLLASFPALALDGWNYLEFFERSAEIAAYQASGDSKFVEPEIEKIRKVYAGSDAWPEFHPVRRVEAPISTALLRGGRYYQVRWDMRARGPGVTGLPLDLGFTIVIFAEDEVYCIKSYGDDADFNAMLARRGIAKPSAESAKALKELRADDWWR